MNANQTLTRTLTLEESEVLDAVQALPDPLKPYVRQAFKMLASSPSDPNPIAVRIVGKSYTPAERLGLELKMLEKSYEYRQELLADAVSSQDLAGAIGTTRQTIHNRLKQGKLLAILDGGQYRFPIWQLDPQGPDGVLEGLPEVLKALPVSEFAKLSWLQTPNPIFDGLTPVEMLKQGQWKRALLEAPAVGPIA